METNSMEPSSEPPDNARPLADMDHAGDFSVPSVSTAAEDQIHSHEDTASSHGSSEARKDRRSKRRRKSRRGDAHQQSDRGHHESAQTPHRKRKFTLAPANLLDGILFLWAFRLVLLVLRAESIHDVPFHLKATESARVSGDALEKAWTNEKDRIRLNLAQMSVVGSQGKPVRYYCLLSLMKAYEILTA
jgi:hypothetical protein